VVKKVYGCVFISWLKYLDALYKDIEQWLSDFENHDMISFEYRDIELNEDLLIL